MESAIRRRPGRAIVVVLIVLVALAGVVILITGGALAELTGDASNSVFAEIRIRPPERLMFDTGAEPQDFEEYRQTHARLLKSFFVLQSAIRPAEVAKLDLIRRQPHPIDWLEDSLAVGSPGKEFLRVSLPGHKSAEAAAIVNAVVTAYMREVVDKEHETRRRRLTELEKIAQSVAAELDRLRNDKRRQRELSAVPSAPGIELLDLDLMRQEYTRLRLKRIELEATAAADGRQDETEADEAAGEPDPQRRQLETVVRQIEACEAEYRAVLDRKALSSMSGIALDEIDRQTAGKEKILEQLRDQIGKLTIELSAPIAIEVFREAMAIE